MHFVFTPFERRRLYWQIAHRWARIRLHKRLIVACLFAGIFLGLLLSNASPAIYASKVVIDTGVVRCEHALAITDTCSWCEEAKRPLSLRLARVIDSAAMRLGFDNLDLESSLEKVATKTKQK